ncbi:hypothetical protein HU200_044209 [Digitaria exilis]|uniref:RING-type E3 ubiquitin transferase n=1 Tax=Digitaria exilis TaxID=1010633 RepID=A0A835EGU3_9POAL|nr:hypothetical protein HU200_044209 [Digitaria exilis]
MTTGALDCPICYDPLEPPIYQCGVGHLICKSCCAKLKKCPVCPRIGFERCFGMEHVVESIEVSCSFAKHGCTKSIVYFNKKRHEKACRHGPCFCPETGCNFIGPALALMGHLTAHHKWSSKAFRYYEQVELRLQPVPCVLHSRDGHVFLMNVVPAEPFGLAISLLCVQPEATDSRFRCSVVCSCFAGHSQMSKLDAVRSSMLSDGMPKDFFCIVPKPKALVKGADVVLRITIAPQLVFDEEDKEQEDEGEDNESYNDEEDEDDDEEEE